MKISKLLREAAKRVETGSALCACDAISDVIEYEMLQRSIRKQALQYLRKFAPSGVSQFSYWFGEPYQWDSNSSKYVTNEVNQNKRITALCFAAALAESEGN